MAYATNKHGFRNIVVAGKRCRWRLCIGPFNSALIIQSADNQGGQQVYALFPGYPDPWLHFPNLVPQLTATPALVRRVIEQAFALGWQPELRARPLRFTVSSEHHPSAYQPL